MGVSGSVVNTGEGVIIDAMAPAESLLLFLKAIENEAPPLARIDSMESRSVDGCPDSESLEPAQFRILLSESRGNATTAIPPDISLCSDCGAEISSPANRRSGYPFTNCTNCGPRFTIVETIPYDRPKTSMKSFTMCSACQDEYNNPADRRFHAQPNGCPLCGPQLSLHDNKGATLAVASPMTATVLGLNNGEVLAIKGLGGFHLAVSGLSEDGIQRLRTRKGRPDKPLAIMVQDIKAAEMFCSLSSAEKELLLSPEHPIVLLKQRPDSLLPANLAPGIEEVGVMLPYTPLHHLLFTEPECPKALVMTSGNISGLPICTKNEEALLQLGPIADKFLLHNREIVTRVDDSLVRMSGEQQLILRRSRGYVPSGIKVNWQLPQILGTGAGLKNTFCLGRGHDVIPSQHIGNLDNLESYDFYQESIDHLQSLYQLEAEAVACDLHPDYPSSTYAAELELPLYRIQHHHAHAVAVMAEHGLEEPVLAIVLDGTGLGDDGTSWGGEILKTGLTDFERLGHLSNLSLPGGDAAATEPWRMALSSLFSTYGEKGLERNFLPPAFRNIEEAKLNVIRSMLINDFNSPPTSSCGRLFDAIASLLGIRQRISYEGQAAMELEALAKRVKTCHWMEEKTPNQHKNYSTTLSKNDGKWEISSTEFVKMVVDGLANGENHSIIALRFHLMLLDSITKLIEILSHQTGIQQVVLSGGCMQNSLLLEGFFHSLKKINVQVFCGNLLPINDGAISIGQTIIGGLRHVSRNSNESDSRSGRS